MARLLEASRPIRVPKEPYQLDPARLPFGWLFAQTSIVEHPRMQGDDDDDDPPKKEPTWSNPETTVPDSNDPTNDEEIDWLKGQIPKSPEGDGLAPI
jgi:hypothetical protein